MTNSSSDKVCVLGICGKSKKIALFGAGAALLTLVGVALIIYFVHKHQESNSMQNSAADNTSPSDF